MAPRFWKRNIAQRYDRTIPFVNRNFIKMLAYVSEDLRRRQHVLEVAAGTGLVTLELAPVVGQLTATDLSPDMLSDRLKIIATQRLWWRT